MINIKNAIKNKINEYFSNEIKEKNNIIKEEIDENFYLKDYINKSINEQERILLNIKKGLRVCEINSNKPEATYRNLRLAKMKIESSIADSKKLLNKYNYEYIPKTNFIIKNLEGQEVIK